jgi:hypothetical protein
MWLHPEERWRAMVTRYQGRPIKIGSVPILLHEYDTLRAEIIQRHSSLYQVVAIVAAAIGTISYLLANRGPSVPRWLFWLSLGLLALAIVIVIIFSQLLRRDIEIATSRLRVIEETVDEAAGEWFLLRWERLYGGGGRPLFGLVRRGDPVPPEPDTSSSASPPDSSVAAERPLHG